MFFVAGRNWKKYPPAEKILLLDCFHKSVLPGPNITRILTPVLGIVFHALSSDAFCLSLHGKKPLKFRDLMGCWRIFTNQNSGFLKLIPPCERASKTMPKTIAKFRRNILSRLHTLHMENS